MRSLILALLTLSISAEARTTLEWQKFLSQPQYLKSFNRNIQTYHYGTLGEAKYKDGKCIDDKCPETLSAENPDLKSYFKALSGAFQELKNTNWTVGGGFYAAIDPIQSSWYGQNPKFAMEINVSKGIHFLEGRTRVKGDKEGRTLSELIKEEVVDAKKPRELTNFMTAIKNLKVGIIAYTWNDAIASACADDAFNSRLTPAFSFILPEMVNELSFHLYTDHADPMDLVTYVPFIQKALMLTLSQKPSDLEPFLQNIYHQLADKVQLTEVVRTSAMNSSFGCNDHYPDEREVKFFLEDHPEYK